MLNYKNKNVKLRQFNSDFITYAENNWWGSDNETEINVSIDDASDIGADPDFGVIDYDPFETTTILDCGIRTGM